jgi:hypothetical protein
VDQGGQEDAEDRLGAGSGGQKHGDQDRAGVPTARPRPLRTTRTRARRRTANVSAVAAARRRNELNTDRDEDAHPIRVTWSYFPVAK